MLIEHSVAKKIETQSGLIDKCPKKKPIDETPIEETMDAPKTKTRGKTLKAKSVVKTEVAEVAKVAKVAEVAEVKDPKQAMAEKMAKLREAKMKKQAEKAKAINAEPVVSAPEKVKKTRKTTEVVSEPIAAEAAPEPKPKRGRKKAEAIVEA